MIASPVWKILDVDEKNERIIGLRPYFPEIWNAGINKAEARMIGGFRGANRGLGRWIHDMDDEFFHGYNRRDRERFVGFYDNEFPVAVGSDTAFDAGIWTAHYQKILDRADDPEDHIQDVVRSRIRDEEQRVSDLVKREGLEYRELIPRSIKRNLIPDDLKANDLF